MVLLIITAGLLSMGPLFTLLGADSETLAVITAYMRIWYPGVLVMVAPMAGFAAIRGLGDTKTPSGIILAAIILNTALDPLLIFGPGPFPELGVAGAALATVIARGTTFLAVIYLLVRREKMIGFHKLPASGIFDLWMEILRIGIPNSLTKLTVPVGLGIITGMVAEYGSDAVAGFGIATRLEMIALVAVSALVAAMPVFLGQNFGDGRWRRLSRGLWFGDRFCLLYGAGLWFVLWFASSSVARLFSDAPGVIDVAVIYMRIVPGAYGFYGMMQLAVISLNVLKKPVHSAAIPLVQLFAVYLPVAWLASGCFGISGIFGALGFSYLVGGLGGSRLRRRIVW
jgi:putative MATE family efflux protein